MCVCVCVCVWHGIGVITLHSWCVVVCECVCVSVCDACAWSCTILSFAMRVSMYVCVHIFICIHVCVCVYVGGMFFCDHSRAAGHRNQHTDGGLSGEARGGAAELEAEVVCAEWFPPQVLQEQGGPTPRWCDPSHRCARSYRRSGQSG
jgi:hypothetical protein